MHETAILLWITIGVAVAFDFTNGFHDTANAIATSISTRALSPRAAVGLSAVFNLVGAVVTVAFFQAKVSNTIASTLAIKPGLVVVMSALLGAISWNLITWYRGLPSSSTHALIGSLCGWRIIRTLGWSIIKLEPVTGLAAQFTGATVIQAATLVGLPVSTTHVVTGSVMGVGAIRKLSAVSWGLGANIALAWLVTIPAAAI